MGQPATLDVVMKRAELLLQVGQDVCHFLLPLSKSQHVSGSMLGCQSNLGLFMKIERPSSRRHPCMSSSCWQLAFPNAGCDMQCINSTGSFPAHPMAVGASHHQLL